MPQIYRKFKHVLYYLLIESGRYNLQDVARKMNISASSLYHYCEDGGPTFPVDLLANLYNATKDRELVNFILNDTDLLATHRQYSSGGKNVLEETLESAAASGNVVQNVQFAMKDGKMDGDEIKDIERTIDTCEKELEDLRKCLRAKLIVNPGN